MTTKSQYTASGSGLPTPDSQTPKASGYQFPAEWHPHRATWLSWPHKEASWPGKLDAVFAPYSQFIREISAGEHVCINVKDAAMEAFASEHLINANVDLSAVTFYHHPTDDAWCRDHGPAFLINPEAAVPKVIVDWGYNAWGNKYPPYEQDDVIPTLVGEALGIPVYHPGIVMEGGSVDFNGAGTILTSMACLLNKNRNPQLNQQQIEAYLYAYYGASQVLWLGDGIVGDDTDGHIDDITRFVNADTVVTVIEENRSDENYSILQDNLQLLKKMRLPDGKPLKIIELPMPKPVIYDGQRLPASYANFYIANAAVIVPTYRDDSNDQKALDILSACFPERRVVGIDSTDIIWGLGSWHCLSQQEPDVV
ncbi:agmatine deiminase family protein [Parapedobacter sp. ISTM3]|uniref:Agmatine deiminase n=1 Tax=Parapedobacter luteus TaxID=623280 RepID=A0A1T5E406_9SPHI|nr:MULTISPECIES: agmatine deiminase family protein [Parapedobacter]MBK1441056.1 agmatine deiminase family protein [Parapedobacter sp. ISTM3]SKB78540.1 agmatine deiminase [Parapedobacter luteus]